MKSIAVWYTPKDKNNITLTDIELHFNFWKIPNGAKKPHRFLDFGLKLSDTENVKCLNIYFPTEVKATDFEDIVSRFIFKADLVSAIFNENYQVISDATSKSFKIRDKDELLVFDIYKTSENDLEFASAYGGTIVSIKILKQSDKSYYRFRLKGNYIDSITTISKPTNALLESAFSEIEMIDFRVNEIRDINQDLLEKIREEVFLKIQKHHFFFICSNEEEVVGNHQPYLSCRNLENYRWSDYVGLPKINDKIFLAYHWKEKDRESVSTLIKTKYEKNNWLTIAKYFIIGFIIAVSIELFSNWLYDFLK